MQSKNLVVISSFLIPIYLFYSVFPGYTMPDVSAYVYQIVTNETTDWTSPIVFSFFHLFGLSFMNAQYFLFTFQFMLLYSAFFCLYRILNSEKRSFLFSNISLLFPPITIWISTINRDIWQISAFAIAFVLQFKKFQSNAKSTSNLYLLLSYIFLIFGILIKIPSGVAISFVFFFLELRKVKFVVTRVLSSFIIVIILISFLGFVNVKTAQQNLRPEKQTMSIYIYELSKITGVNLFPKDAFKGDITKITNTRTFFDLLWSKDAKLLNPVIINNDAVDSNAFFSILLNNLNAVPHFVLKKYISVLNLDGIDPGEAVWNQKWWIDDSASYDYLFTPIGAKRNLLINSYFSNFTLDTLSLIPVGDQGAKNGNIVFKVWIFLPILLISILVLKRRSKKLPVEHNLIITIFLVFFSTPFINMFFFPYTSVRYNLWIYFLIPVCMILLSKPKRL